MRVPSAWWVTRGGPGPAVQSGGGGSVELVATAGGPPAYPTYVLHVGLQPRRTLPMEIPAGCWVLIALGLQALDGCSLILVGAGANSFAVPHCQLLPNMMWGACALALPAPLPLLSKGAPAHSALPSLAINPLLNRRGQQM